MKQDLSFKIITNKLDKNFYKFSLGKEGWGSILYKKLWIFLMCYQQPINVNLSVTKIRKRNIFSQVSRILSEESQFFTPTVHMKPFVYYVTQNTTKRTLYRWASDKFCKLKRKPTKEILRFWICWTSKKQFLYANVHRIPKERLF